jgi:hypothetical protein
MADLAKLRPDLQAVLAMAKLEPAHSTLVRDCADTAAALTRLEDAGQLTGAARLGGFALPRREAVWWASMCASHTAPPHQPELEQRMREAAELWVRRQDDDSRRAAMDLARLAGFNTPEAWVAVAAFWSDGSMAPRGQPVVPPGVHLTGTAVGGAVALASVRGDPARQPVRLSRFLASLREIADGGAGRLASEVLV